MEPVLDTPEEFAKIVKTQQEKDSALVKGLDLKTTQWKRRSLRRANCWCSGALSVPRP